MTGSSYYSMEKAAAWRSSGSTQTQARVYNERLILSLIRLHGELSKVELTQLTSLAPQTITSIVNEAAANALVLRGKPRRGGLGQPSVPYALNPSGAWSFGLAMDAEGIEIVLTDFLGKIVEGARTLVAPLSPAAVIEAADAGIKALLARHNDIPSDRIAGLGIASPFYGSAWPAALGLGNYQASEWERIDLRAELDARFEWPVYLLPDGVVAAGGELTFGAGLGRTDFIYLHLGDRVSAGLVLDHRLHTGRNRLAGMIGDFAVGAATLNEIASLRSLPTPDGADPQNDQAYLADPAVAEWVAKAASALGAFAWQAVSLLDVDDVIVDADAPPALTKALVRAISRDLSRAAATRPAPLSVQSGTLGLKAFATGAASIPLMVRFGSDTEVLFK